jgi:hypothetical protein
MNYYEFIKKVVSKVNWKGLIKFTYFIEKNLNINICILKVLSLMAFGPSAFPLAVNPLFTFLINPDNLSPDKQYSDKFPEEK